MKIPLLCTHSFIRSVIQQAFFIVLIVCPVSAHYAETGPDITVRSEIDSGTITIGDPVTYEVLIRHEPEIQLLSSIPPPDGDILKIKKIEDIRIRDGKHIVEGKRFILTAYRLGDFIIAPVTIKYRKQDGNAREIGTTPIYLKVKSVAEGEEKQDIRDIKSVTSIPSHLTQWFVAGLTLGLFIALLLGFLKSRQKKLAELKATPSLTPEADAYLRLNRLFDSNLIRDGKIQEYYLELSDILRSYMERRYSFLAREATSIEIMRHLKSRSIDALTADLIREVLEASDLAKFAKWRPQPAEILQINHKTKKIIEHCTPPAEAASPSEALSHGI